MKFPEKLKTLRTEANLTQNEMANELMISKQVISNYEQGRSYPSIDVLVEMSKFFHTSLDELLSSGARRRHVKYVTALVCLIFLGNIVNYLLMIIKIKNAFPALNVIFVNAIELVPFMFLFAYLIFQYNPPPKKIDNFYGYRTKLSMKNQLMWDYAQEYFSLTLAVISLILYILGIIFSVVSIFLSLNAYLIVGCSLCCVQIISLLSPIYFVEKKLKEFNKKN